MELGPEDRAFRDELVRWLDANADAVGDRVEWHRRLVADRWAVPSWPTRFGGRACSVAQEILFTQEMATRDAPLPRNEVALWNIGPTLIALGTAAQQARYLPAMLAADEIWCQGFSEPNAGSDLAGLETRAEDCGDHWQLTGQKMWTTYADHADRCLALVRTNPSVAKHRGISAVLVDMHAPGVTVRQIREITGEAGFNEIFFDGVKVPKEDLVGEVDGGWKVAMQILVYERIGTMKLGAMLEKRLAGVVALAKELGKSRDPLVRDELAARAIDVHLMSLLTERALDAVARGEDPGNALPLGKLQWSYLMQDLAEVAMRIGGPRALLWRGARQALPGDWPYLCVQARQTTILAGTTEVQKNILANRELGLPRDAGIASSPAAPRDLRLDETRAALRDQVRRFLREVCPIAYVRRMLDDPRGTTDAVWQQLAELGLLGVIVPAELGGLGLGYEDLGVVLEELGRALHPGPYFSSAVASVAALRAVAGDDDTVARALLPRIASGEAVCALAHLDAPAHATQGDGAYRVSGCVLVPDGAAADVLLVSAHLIPAHFVPAHVSPSQEGELGLFAIEARDATVVPQPTVDGTRKLAEVTLNDTHARRIGSGDATAALQHDAGLRIAVGLVADAVGAADAALEIATEYAKVRRQFDRPIGSFQAIQHKLADMLRNLELARAGVGGALKAADGSDPAAFGRAAHAAKAFGSEALYRVTADAIQVFGGIGFTWEHDAHLFYKRTLSMRLSHGSAAEHREAYARMLVDGERF